MLELHTAGRIDGAGACQDELVLVPALEPSKELDLRVNGFSFRKANFVRDVCCIYYLA